MASPGESAATSNTIPTKEMFYSNLNGTSTLEISIIASGAPVCVLICFCVLSVLACVFGMRLKTWSRFLVEFSTLVLPCIVGVTLLNQNALPILVTYIVTCITLLAVLFRWIASTKGATISTILDTSHCSSKLYFVTGYRVYAMITTVICILAVDFVAFPRRLAKTETYGTGLMDLGVGCFTFANALVSPEGRGSFKEIKGLASGLRAICKSAVSSIPILVLGFIRLASVKSTGYHEHVSEYGVHWNFFFTLATVSIFSSICLTLVTPHMSGILSLVLAAAYQNQLTNQGLGDFVLHGNSENDSREGLLNANREGLVSCIGYLVIYLSGVQLGRFFFLPRSSLREYCVLFIQLCVADVLLCVMLHYSATTLEPVCRRSANLSYIIWILAYSVQLLACFLLVEIIITIAKYGMSETLKGIEQKDSSKDKQPITDSQLITAIDYNLLLVFLLANLLTGVVNMSINTIEAQPITGFVIVTMYMLILCIIVTGLYRYKIRIKFW